ncbi:hypothetical protein AVEN_226084-1 [Araneus ventricosus]|uniref:Reverse transcriptase RNase H-like domain-containing protein n=1 Tax=Araneus ventricosus TaxID=182803 RepID=A0A4Y2GVR4_ARAVE|nr:hypothetical protein AVEN_226084-1 [Araneus ventricosus]
MQKVNEIFGFLSPKQLTTLDNKTLREKASTLRNLYRDDLDKDELSVEIESFKYTVDAGLTIKPIKCKFAQDRVKCLGHIVGRGIRTPNEVKVKAVLDFPVPTTKSQVRAFLRLAGYYNHYIPMFSSIVAPLTETLKAQKDDNDKEHPELYLSKKFSETEKKYSTTERECATIIFAVKKLQCYLDGHTKFLIMTDHNPLVWLKNNVSLNPRHEMGTGITAL